MKMTDLFKGSVNARLMDTILDKHCSYGEGLMVRSKYNFSIKQLAEDSGVHYVSTSVGIRTLLKLGFIRVAYREDRIRTFCLNVDSRGNMKNLIDVLIVLTESDRMGVEA